ncbi:MAG TPA: 23S rRNA (pseudouridine(1915)-N(3))-methyltransferase RlmH [Kiloniellales bacterium]|nr:23S rRNA (pseudouridine(1915)-N(3))-methyltransferase RlmH [Kiloniellales bacterium]
MRLTLVAVGRGRGHPAQALYEDYARQLTGRPLGPLTLKEVQERRALPAAELIAAEAKLIRAALPAGAALVTLDSRGQSMNSEAFARRLGLWRDQSREAAFVIGGAEGLEAALRDEADLVLSLGPMTWPHLLVRALLAEQLFRAQAILTGHPYHRD